MSEKMLVAQLFTLRDFCKTPADIAESMKKVKAMGYDVVQLSALGPIDPKELKAILDGEGLTACVTHVNMKRLQEDMPGIIEEHRALDCRFTALGSLPGEYKSLEGYKRGAAELTAFGKALSENGITFGYHNHAFEFEKYEGRLGLDILYEESDPEYLKAEIDTYWVQYGGRDPAAWIRKMKGRIPFVHLKDMTMRNNEQIMAEVGEGNLNWPEILNACEEVGVEQYIVEQDRCERDPFESLKISLDNLNKMFFYATEIYSN